MPVGGGRAALGWASSAPVGLRDRGGFEPRPGPRSLAAADGAGGSEARGPRRAVTRRLRVQTLRVGRCGTLSRRLPVWYFVVRGVDGPRVTAPPSLDRGHHMTEGTVRARPPPPCSGESASALSSSASGTASAAPRDAARSGAAEARGRLGFPDPRIRTRRASSEGLDDSRVSGSSEPVPAVRCGAEAAVSPSAPPRARLECGLRRGRGGDCASLSPRGAFLRTGVAAPRAERRAGRAEGLMSSS